MKKASEMGYTELIASYPLADESLKGAAILKEVKENIDVMQQPLFDLRPGAKLAKKIVMAVPEHIATDIEGVIQTVALNKMRESQGLDPIYSERNWARRAQKILGGDARFLDVVATSPIIGALFPDRESSAKIKKAWDETDGFWGLPALFAAGITALAESPSGSVIFEGLGKAGEGFAGIFGASARGKQRGLNTMESLKQHFTDIALTPDILQEWRDAETSEDIAKTMESIVPRMTDLNKLIEGVIANRDAFYKAAELLDKKGKMNKNIQRLITDALQRRNQILAQAIYERDLGIATINGQRNGAKQFYMREMLSMTEAMTRATGSTTWGNVLGIAHDAALDPLIIAAMGPNAVRNAVVNAGKFALDAGPRAAKTAILEGPKALLKVASSPRATREAVAMAGQHYKGAIAAKFNQVFTETSLKLGINIFGDSAGRAGNLYSISELNRIGGAMTDVAKAKSLFSAARKLRNFKGNIFAFIGNKLDDALKSVGMNGYQAKSIKSILDGTADDMFGEIAKDIGEGAVLLEKMKKSRTMFLSGEMKKAMKEIVDSGITPDEVIHSKKPGGALSKVFSTTRVADPEMYKVIREAEAKVKAMTEKFAPDIEFIAKVTGTRGSQVSRDIVAALDSELGRASLAQKYGKTKVWEAYEKARNIFDDWADTFNAEAKRRVIYDVGKGEEVRLFLNETLAREFIDKIGTGRLTTLHKENYFPHWRRFIQDKFAGDVALTDNITFMDDVAGLQNVVDFFMKNRVGSILDLKKVDVIDALTAYNHAAVNAHIINPAFKGLIKGAQVTDPALAIYRKARYADYLGKPDKLDVMFKTIIDEKILPHAQKFPKVKDFLERLGNRPVYRVNRAVATWNYFAFLGFNPSVVMNNLFQNVNNLALSDIESFTRAAANRLLPNSAVKHFWNWTKYKTTDRGITSLINPRMSAGNVFNFLTAPAMKAFSWSEDVNRALGLTTFLKDPHAAKAINSIEGKLAQARAVMGKKSLAKLEGEIAKLDGQIAIISKKLETQGAPFLAETVRLEQSLTSLKKAQWKLYAGARARGELLSFKTIRELDKTSALIKDMATQKAKPLANAGNIEKILRSVRETREELIAAAKARGRGKPLSFETRREIAKADELIESLTKKMEAQKALHLAGEAKLERGLKSARGHQEKLIAEAKARKESLASEIQSDVAKVEALISDISEKLEAKKALNSTEAAKHSGKTAKLGRELEYLRGQQKKLATEAKAHKTLRSLEEQRGEIYKRIYSDAVTLQELTQFTYDKLSRRPAYLTNLTSLIPITDQFFTFVRNEFEFLTKTGPAAMARQIERGAVINRTGMSAGKLFLAKYFLTSMVIDKTLKMLNVDFSDALGVSFIPGVKYIPKDPTELFLSPTPKLLKDGIKALVTGNAKDQDKAVSSVEKMLFTLAVTRAVGAYRDYTTGKTSKYKTQILRGMFPGGMKHDAGYEKNLLYAMIRRLNPVKLRELRENNPKFKQILEEHGITSKMSFMEFLAKASGVRINVEYWKLLDETQELLLEQENEAWLKYGLKTKAIE